MIIGGDFSETTLTVGSEASVEESGCWPIAMGIKKCGDGYAYQTN